MLGHQVHAGWIRDPVQMIVQQEFGECWMCSNIQFDKIGFKKDRQNESKISSVMVGHPRYYILP